VVISRCIQYLKLENSFYHGWDLNLNYEISEQQILPLNHTRNGQIIFRHIFQLALNLVRHTLVAVKESTENENLFVRLEKSLQAGVRFLQEHPRIYSLYLKIQFDRQTPFRQELLAAVRRYAGEYFGSLISRARARGELRPGISDPAVLFLLDAVFDRFLQAAAVPYLDVTFDLHQAPEETVQRRIRELIDLLKEGLAA
jgi:hypothetical protein